MPSRTTLTTEHSITLKVYPQRTANATDTLLHRSEASDNEKMPSQSSQDASVWVWTEFIESHDQYLARIMATAEQPQQSVHPPQSVKPVAKQNKHRAIPWPRISDMRDASPLWLWEIFVRELPLLDWQKKPIVALGNNMWEARFWKAL